MSLSETDQESAREPTKNGSQCQVAKRLSGQHLKFKSPVSKDFKSPVSKQFKSPFSKTPYRLSNENLIVSKQPQQRVVLQEQLQEAETEIAELRARGYQESELQIHIEKLHEYNEIKDVGQMVLGRIAVVEGIQTKEVYPRYLLHLSD